MVCWLCYTLPMLSLDFIRQHPGVVLEGLRRRGDPQGIDEILRLAEQRRGLITRCDGLYVELKDLNNKVRTASEDKRAGLNKQIKAVARDIRQLEIRTSDIDTHLQPLLLALPNIPHASVHEGDDDREIKRWGEPVTFHFEPH